MVIIILLSFLSYFLHIVFSRLSIYFYLYAFFFWCLRLSFQPSLSVSMCHYLFVCGTATSFTTDGISGHNNFPTAPPDLCKGATLSGRALLMTSRERGEPRSSLACRGVNSLFWMTGAPPAYGVRGQIHIVVLFVSSPSCFYKVKKESFDNKTPALWLFVFLLCAKFNKRRRISFGSDYSLMCVYEHANVYSYIHPLVEFKIKFPVSFYNSPLWKQECIACNINIT